ncbi:MAG: hypothetical protein K9H14_08025 [Actinomycetia bacterium]|nr:hypothetical protein [Actinomycetes bacterium]
MKLKQIHELAVQLGAEAVPIGGKNFPDCQVLNLPQAEVKTIYAGIDIGVGELLLIDKLRSCGQRIDAVLSHHPLAKAAYLMAEVARIQEKNWVRCGVDKEVAGKLADKLIREANLEAGSANYLQVRDSARLLGLPLISLHTALDNLVQKFFIDLLADKENDSLEQVLEDIQSIEECRISSEDGVKPYSAGKADPKAKLGNCLVDMTGGLDPLSEIFEHLKEAGIDTMVGMHYGMENIKAMEESGMACLVCGHMAGDSIGINLFCDQLAARGIKVIAGSGLYRVERLDHD